MKRHVMDLPRPDEQFDPVPWMVIGVFPTEEGPPWPWNWFNYTVGASPEWDLWCSCMSIEERHGGNELIATALNFIATGLLTGELFFGDDLVFPLGVPNSDDVDCVFWIGYPRNNNPQSRMQTYRTNAPSIVPVQWSSGLGWK